MTKKSNWSTIVATILSSIALLSSVATSFVPPFPSVASVLSANSKYNNHHYTMTTTTTSMIKKSPFRQRRPRPLHPPHFSSSQPEIAPIANTSSPSNSSIFEATLTLQSYDQSQQAFQQQFPELSLGLSSLQHIQSLSPSTRSSLQAAIRTLVNRAHIERAEDSSRGRIMLGICASNAPEALAGLKSWVSSLSLPRGMLHGMDVDGVPIPVEDLGAVYVKYSTGGAMTFSEMRRTGRGFDALWRPGDALLEGGYDGDFRGVYLNVELGDGVFRQFGVLPTDLFMEEEDW